MYDFQEIPLINVKIRFQYYYAAGLVFVFDAFFYFNGAPNWLSVAMIVLPCILGYF